MPTRALIERKLAKCGFVLERKDFVWSRKRCRWFVCDRSDPGYNAGFGTLYDIRDWLEDREELNASLPVDINLVQIGPPPKRPRGRPRKPDALTQSERDAARMVGAMMMRLPARVAAKVRTLQERDGDATLVDVVERAVERALTTP